MVRVEAVMISTGQSRCHRPDTAYAAPTDGARRPKLVKSGNKHKLKKAFSRYSRRCLDVLVAGGTVNNLSKDGGQTPIMGSIEHDLIETSENRWHQTDKMRAVSDISTSASLQRDCLIVIYRSLVVGSKNHSSSNLVNEPP